MAEIVLKNLEKNNKTTKKAFTKLCKEQMDDKKYPNKLLQNKKHMVQTIVSAYHMLFVLEKTI